MDRDSILADIDQAFDVPRPATMVRNPQHCDECAEHEMTMQQVTPQTVTLEEVGNAGWDPVCFISDEAYCYFMPGLARLALDERGEYLSQFFFQLDQGFRMDAFNNEQRRAVAQVVDYIGESMLEQVIDGMLEIEFDRVRDKLRDNSA